MDESEKFEAFARTKGWNLCRNTNDEYAFAVAAGAWAAWKAALAHQTVKEPQAADLEQYRPLVASMLFDAELVRDACYHDGRQRHVDKCESLKRLLAFIDSRVKPK